jgi:RNA polymerase sigma-70 factor (ECF subfamily)
MPQPLARAEVVERLHVRDAPARRHPPDLFEDAVRRYSRHILSIAYRITRNIDDARDVVQHVFMQLYVKSLDLNDARTVERWLYVVARNEALNVHRRRQRNDAAETSAGDETPPLALEDTVLRNERAHQIRATIARLPPADRHVIELRHLQSMPSTEIATTLGIPVKRVKHDVERAKARLRIEMRRRGLDKDVS